MALSHIQSLYFSLEPKRQLVQLYTTGSIHPIIREKSEQWIHLFMIDDNFRVKFLGSGGTNGSYNAQELDQFHSSFMTYLQSAVVVFQGDLELAGAVKQVENLTPSELYQELATRLTAEVEIYQNFLTQNPKVNEITQESTTIALETLQKKVEECKATVQDEIPMAQNGNEMTAVPYLKVKALYLVSSTARQLHRLSNILLNSPNLIHMLKCSKRDSASESWSEFPVETAKTLFSTLLDLLDRVSSFWTPDRFDTVRNLFPNPQQYRNLDACAWDAATDLVNQLPPLERKFLCNSLTLVKHPPELVKGDESVSISLDLCISPSILVQNLVLEFKVIHMAEAEELVSSNMKIQNIRGLQPPIHFNQSHQPNCMRLSFRQLIPLGNLKRKNPKCQQYLCLLFCVRFQYKGHRIRTWCCSAPFIYRTGNVQKSEAQGAMMWYNLFKKSGNGTGNGNGTSLEVDREVDSNQMSTALSRYFNKILGTNREFTRENCQYLMKQLLTLSSEGNPENEESEKDKITLAMFLSKSRNDGYSFWDWFSRIIDFAKRHLRLFWENGFLLEFMDRIYAEDVILDKYRTPGTFFLRFSDRLPAGVSISFVNSQGESRSIVPFTDRNLQNSSLVQKIHDFGFDLNLFLYHQIHEQGRTTISWHNPAICNPAFSCPPQDDFVLDSLTNRYYIVPHFVSTIFWHLPPTNQRPAPVPVPVEEKDDSNMDTTTAVAVTVAEAFLHQDLMQFSFVANF